MSQTAIAPSPSESQTEGLNKLTADLRRAARTLSRGEARFLVDCFYQMQKQRIVAGNQVKSLDATGDPHAVLKWFNANADFLETQVQFALKKYAEGITLGQWCMAQYGIGPVITAGLLAHISIDRAPSAGHIWSYAGLNPEAVWSKGGMRPWNADLKLLCWKVGESFAACKQHMDKPGGEYIKAVYERWDFEKAKNSNHDYATQAAKIAKARPNHAQVATYLTGELPAGHIWARSKRYGVKLFLAHFHHVAYELRYNRKPPLPYILTHDKGHTHFIAPPLWPLPDDVTKGCAKDLP